MIDGPTVHAALEIARERRRQDKKWGNQRILPAEKWLTILMEEVGEVSEAMLDRKPDRIKEEVIQVAAVAKAWVESIISEEER